MKILNLKFKNINSLSGENEIDFRNPIFTYDGLFAITGKTGAGKSSILDAISLSLYGKTPRVDITANENAVMTRGEKDCYAEIIFEVAGKKWKSSWKQELNKNGNLKPVNRVVADADDKIIADQIRTCDAEIVKIIGLSFEQFTKVIMLAQGSFTAFLQAKQNEKGELLEQITGTEIYAEISKIVFERNRTEKDKLDKISLELEAIKILTEEEIKILTNENTVIEKEKLQVDEELQKIEKAKKWLSDVSNLQTQIKQAKENLPELERKTKTAKEAFDKSEIALKTAKEEQKSQEPIFRKVRELDIKISEKKKLLNPIQIAISDLSKSKTELSKTIESQNVELKKSETLLSEKQQWATENKKYEDLVSNYSAIEKENQLLVNSSQEIKKQNSEIADLQNKLRSIITDTTKETEVFNEKSEKLDAKTKELETKQKELTEFLEGKELSKLQIEKENVSNFGMQVKNLIDVENTIFSNQKEIEDLDERLKQFEKSNNDLSKSITVDKKTIETFEKQINLLDENIKLNKTIQSLDEHRYNLKDGEECPLCGSLEHSFAKGNIPKIGEKEKELASLKKQLQETNNTLQQNEKKLIKLISDNENDIENKAKKENNLLENIEKQKEIWAEIKSINSTFLIPEGENKIERLNDILAQKREELKELNKLIKHATDNEIKLKNLRDKEIPALQKEKESATSSKNEAEKNQTVAEQGLKDKQKVAIKLQEKYNNEKELFLMKLKQYSVENIETLKNHLDSWNENKKQIENLTTQITVLQRDFALNKKELENQTNLFDDKQKEKQNTETEMQNLFHERKEIFTDKSVENEENRLRKLIEDSESSKTKAEQEKTETDKKLAENKAIVSEKEKELLNTQEQKITEKTNEELQLELDEKKKKSDELSQKIGANNQKLIANSEHLKTSSSKLKEKEKQQAICNKWSILNNLIGSSDGKKYRNFAQVLTFEHLIALSNKQLQKMSERYLLKRTGDNLNPFELLVIDKYQNNEERTAQNLSGGEKFIISLSLALGLANMASKNMRIDTMFIDEGFGTLDSDYLDIALNALSNLQNEGKIIGVISHLSELKERIATHIEVIPSGNGHSKIQITTS